MLQFDRYSLKSCPFPGNKGWFGLLMLLKLKFVHVSFYKPKRKRTFRQCWHLYSRDNGPLLFGIRNIAPFTWDSKVSSVLVRDKTEFGKVPTEAEARSQWCVFISYLWGLKVCLLMTTGLLFKEKAPYFAFTQFILSAFMMFITVFSPDNRWRLHMFADGPVIYVYLYTFFTQLFLRHLVVTQRKAWNPVTF